MPKNEIGEYDETDSGNTDISGIGLSDATLIDQLDNIARAMMGALKRWFKSSLFRLRDSTDQTKLLAFDLAGLPTATTTTFVFPAAGGTLATTTTLAPKGHIYGLTLSNNVTDAANDIDIAAGEASSDSATPVLMALASALTKRLDAAWAVGTNQGMLDGSESVAGTPDTSTWYHIHLIKRVDTGVVDVLASESATAPTLPTNYTHSRRIGAVYNDSAGDIKAFQQTGDDFIWNVPPGDYVSSGLSTSRELASLSCPPSVVAKVRAVVFRAAGAVAMLIQPVYESDAAPSGLGAPASSLYTETANGLAAGQFLVKTDASSQIAVRSSASSTNLAMVTLGWTDTRGRL